MTRRVPAAVALVGATLLVMAGPAAAHAVLLASSPADGAELDHSPAEVVLEFSEPVHPPPQAVRVFDSDGERVDLGDVGPGNRPASLRVGLPGELPDGVYTVSWRAVSADAHPVRGAFVFVVGELPEGVEAQPLAAVFDDRQRAAGIAAAVARWVVYAGALLAAGGALFLAFVHDRRAAERRPLGRVVVLAAAAAAAASVLAVPVQTALVTGLGARALVDPALLGETLVSGFGAAVAVRLAGLALTLTAVARLWRPGSAALAVAGAAVTAGSFLLVGHTVVSEPRWLAAASNYAHTLAAAVWFGGLVLLWAALRARRREGDALGGARMVSRFSNLAAGTVVALVMAGTALAWVEVRALRALAGTTYGQLLVAKIVLVAGVVAAAAYNNRRLVPAVRAGSQDAWRKLSATVRLEVVGLAAVLAVTAVLVVVVPARVAAGIGGPLALTVPLGATHEVHAVVDPAEVGFNEFHLYLLDDLGRTADIGEEVILRLSHPGRDIAPVERAMSRAGPGHYLHAGPELAIPGRWTVEIGVLVSEFERLTATFEVDVGGSPR